LPKIELLSRSGIEIKTPLYGGAFLFLSVAPKIQISNELLEDTRDMAKIWDLFGNLVKGSQGA
jgi:hypothetical protein